MKDTIITSKRKQLELKTLLACFIIMNLLNIYSIYTFNIYIQYFLDRSYNVFRLCDNRFFCTLYYMDNPTIVFIRIKTYP